MIKFVLLCVICCVLFGCNDKNYSSLVLVHNKTISQYNDTTFNSWGSVSHFSDGYVIADFINKFVVIVNHDVNNLEIIGRLGSGPDEYPDIPRSFVQVGNNLYTCVARKLFVYDLQQKLRKEIEISSFSGFIRDNLVYQRENQLIFPLHGHEYNFVSYNLNDGKIDYFHKNRTLNKLFLERTHTALLTNDVFVVVKYDRRRKKGFILSFSLSDDNIRKATEIPLNLGILKILQAHSQAPAFDRISVWQNRVFIAYNATGLVTTEFDASGQNDDWIYLDYPDEEDKDRVILSNFCITDENLIFVNFGLLRFYENPFYDIK